jgi:pimeloyl-ACP methyl ester carboxylesterase
MTRIQAHVRSHGAGAPLILLHSSASSGRQWQPLMQQLGSQLQSFAVDLYGHGSTPAWSNARPMTLEDDCELLTPLLDRYGPVHLVGHSYGGAIALKTAIRNPEQVLSIALYEPVLFRLALDYQRRDRTAQDVLQAAASIRNWLERGALERAAERFIDYWSGAGAWAQTPPMQRALIAARMPAVVAQFHALFGDGTTRTDLGGITVPMLYLTGARTRPIARRVGELIELAIPHGIYRRVEAAGHMGPVTHAAAVNAQIAGFLEWQLQRAAARPTWLRAA